jgi:3-deoxy-D-manno-octulosonic-acid transferase
VRPLTGIIWSAAASLARPGLRLMLRQRVGQGKEVAERLAERRGVETAQRPAGRVLWLHAASVGEAVSALPLVAALPDEIFTVFTTGTVTSARLLETRLPALGLQDRVQHRFVPLDVPGWVSRFLRHWQPDAACFVESEFWPNTLAACARLGVPVALVNARLSKRSAKGWGRAPALAREMLATFTWIAAQSEADAQRLRDLGAARVDVPGNLKHGAPSLPADMGELARLRALAADRPRWLAASTHPADDAVVARVHEKLLLRFPALLTAVAPRHPERGAAVATAMGGAKRRSLGEDFGAADHAWVADTVGEMGLLYRLFPTVFMGKSFFAGGGQNFLEPARLGCAVATGPRTQNFVQARDMAVAAGALTVVENEAALLAWLEARLGEVAPAKSYAPQGDLPRVLAERLVGLMKPDVGRWAEAHPTGTAVAPAPGNQPGFWRFGASGVVGALLSPVSYIVAAGTARRVARPGWVAPVPVICCGNATVGGAGKTTLALDLAVRLQARGLRVHVLTRGYGGSARATLRVDPAIHDSSQVGDEALLLAAVAPTWRGADRAASAALAVANGAQVLLMDDGLQNPGLAKTASLLVIDGPSGFGNGRVLPAGPLREPVRAAAARCDAAVLIGVDSAGAIKCLPVNLPILRARLLPAPEIGAFAGRRVVAFAGIGRPDKFFAMLRDAGVLVVKNLGFPDHHAFTPAELTGILELARDLEARAVTTPKDFMRIPKALRSSFTSIGVSLQWEDEASLSQLLDQILEKR